MIRMLSLAAAAALVSTAVLAQSLPTPTAGGAPMAFGTAPSLSGLPLPGGTTVARPAIQLPSGAPSLPAVGLPKGAPVAMSPSFGGGAMGQPMGLPTLSVSPGGGGGGTLPSAKSVGGPVFGKVTK